MLSTHTISEPLLALDELEKRLRLAQLHQEVDVVLVLKGIVEVNDVGMLELHVNFDFTFELSLVPRLLQSVFVDDLPRHEVEHVAWRGKSHKCSRNRMPLVLRMETQKPIETSLSILTLQAHLSLVSQSVNR